MTVAFDEMTGVDGASRPPYGELSRWLGEIPADGDIAEVVVFFASDRARMVTGQSLLVNAGEFPH